MSGQADVVAEQVDELNNALPDLLADATLTQALELLATVRGARQQLAELEAIVERHAAQAMPKARFEEPGVFARRRKKSKSVTWLVDDAAHAVVRAAAVDVETGARPWVNRAVSALVNCAGIGYFRTEQMQLLGLDPDEYRTSLPGGFSVEVQIGTEEAA
jgi:hypothetical protein